MSNPMLQLDPTSLPGHPTLEETAAFAGTLHAGQTDKAGAPYIGHLIRVSRHLVRLFPRATPVERHAAWLHDALEDTPVTAADLRGRGYAPEVIEIVEAVTKDPGSGQTYSERIETLAARGPRGALRVKIADLTDNGDPTRLAALPEDKAASLGRRYAQARDRLLAALDAPHGALASDDDPDEVPVPLLLQLPAVDHWTLGEAARLADRDIARFAVEELIGLAHRIVAEGSIRHIALERNRQEAERPALDAFRASDRKHAPLDAWAVRQVAREAQGKTPTLRDTSGTPRAVPPKPSEPPRGS